MSDRLFDLSIALDRSRRTLALMCWSFLVRLILLSLLSSSTSSSLAFRRPTVSYPSQPFSRSVRGIFTMSGVREQLLYTDSHIYSKNDLIGRGATADVYKGVERKTGCLHALKVSRSTMETKEITREIAALVTLQHENVVKMFRMETELTQGSLVVVMEYCPGGSLFTALQEPGNSRGLSDTEFRRLLKHLSAGLQHIQEYGYIHRDLKPGNILIAWDPEGRSVYKLADFGSAKQLDYAEASYESIAGTEEYLHPDVYFTAFVNRRSGNQFTSSSDRWSLGVTLYHAATGQMPFKPFLGARQDRNTMLEMTSTKPPGAIAGSQSKWNGAIQWQSALPKHTNMSRALKREIEPVLKGLIERDVQRQWSYSTFFAEEHRISSEVEFHVCHASSTGVASVYVDCRARLSKLLAVIRTETDIPQADQFILYDGLPLLDLVDNSTRLDRFPETDPAKPLVVLNKSCVQVAHPPEALRPNETFVKFSEHLDVDYDTKAALNNCERVHRVFLHLAGLVALQTALADSSRKLGRHFTAEVFNLTVRLQEIEVTFTERCQRLEMMGFSSLTASVNQSMSQIQDSIKERTKQIRTRLMESSSLMSTAKASLKDISELVGSGRPNFKSRLAVVTTSVRQMNDVYKSFKTRHGKSRLSSEDEVLHAVDRTRMETLSKEAMELWNGCYKDIVQLRKHFMSLNSVFSDGYKTYNECRKHIAYLNKENSKLEEDIKRISELTINERSDVRARITRSLKQIPSLRPGVIEENQQLLLRFEDLITSLPEVIELSE